MRIAILLALAAVVAYSSNLVLTVEANASPNVLTAASWIAEGNADLDEYVGRAPFTEQIVNGHVYPLYPPGTPLLVVAPVAVAMAAGIDVASWEFLSIFGKIVGVLTAGISVAFLYLACARLTRPVPALIAAAAYAFGTTVWTISAQQLWMHGPAQLFVAIGLFLLIRGRGSPTAGLALALAAVIRPVDALAAGAGLLIARRRRFALRYVAWSLPPVAFLATYYLIAFRGIRDSYGDAAVGWFFPPPGWLGLLISPSRGLFVYSPFLLFALAGFVIAWRRRPDEPSLIVRDASLAALGIYIVYSFFGQWMGGWAYGTRYLSDAQPLFALGLAYAIERGLLTHAVARVGFAVTLAWSVFLEYAGAGWYFFFWNGYHWDATPNIDETGYRVWDVSDTQWGFVLRHMVADPGTTLVPTLLGAVLAGFIVWRALASARKQQGATMTSPWYPDAIEFARRTGIDLPST
jgi:hypothetical protein